MFSGESEIEITTQKSLLSSTIRKLNRWKKSIDQKIIALRRAGKIYSVLGVFNKITIATLSAILIALNSSLFTYDGDSIIITLITLQVTLAMFTAFETVINPSKLSKQCSMTWKSYSELSRELSVVIDDLVISDEEPEKSTLSNLALLYSTKEQLILQNEPAIFFSKANKTAIN